MSKVINQENLALECISLIEELVETLAIYRHNLPVKQQLLQRWNGKFALLQSKVEQLDSFGRKRLNEHFSNAEKLQQFIANRNRIKET